VLSVIRFSELDEAIRINNEVKYGLSSSLYTRDVNGAFRAMQELDNGITYVNAPTIGAEAHLPFGGVKQTGNGHREGGWEVYEFYSETKVCYVDYSGKLQRAQIDNYSAGRTDAGAPACSRAQPGAGAAPRGGDGPWRHDRQLAYGGFRPAPGPWFLSRWAHDASTPPIPPSLFPFETGGRPPPASPPRWTPPRGASIWAEPHPSAWRRRARPELAAVAHLHRALDVGGVKAISTAIVLFLVIRTFSSRRSRSRPARWRTPCWSATSCWSTRPSTAPRSPSPAALPAFAEPRGRRRRLPPPARAAQELRQAIVGLPGDTLEMRDKALYLNGSRSRSRTPAPRPLPTRPTRACSGSSTTWWTARSTPRYRPTRDNWGPLVVPDGKFFALGDNRDNSEDSRYWGFLDAEAVRGRPMFVYYSFSRDPMQPSPGSPDVRWRGSASSSAEPGRAGSALP
jgi:signal peptidase I